MKFFRKCSVGTISLALLLAAAVPCVGGNLPALQPTAQMHTETLYVVRCLSGIHYDRRPISSSGNGDVIDAYLNDLDPQRIFFLQRDIDDIHSRYDLTLDIFLNSGSVKPGFAIYELFRGLASERLKRVNELLSCANGDFSGDYFEPDRKEVPWAESEEELEDVWRKMIEFDMLNEVLAADGKKCAEGEDGLGTALAVAKEKLRKRYERYEDSICDVEPYHVQELFLNSVTGMYDPHSSFMAAPTWDDFQSSALTNSITGIGAVLQDDDGYCKIVEIYAGSPAERSNALRVGDKILAVQQGTGEPVDIIGMRLNRAVKLIKGPKGTEVTLHIQPADGDPSERKVVTLIRDEIQLTFQRARAKVFEIPDSRGEILKLGYVKLPAFYGGTPEKKCSCCDDIEELLRKLAFEDVRGLILDLRGNSGGLLDEAVAIAGLFLGGGPIVQVRDGEGHTQLFAEPDREVFYGGPLLVLTSKQSASASEILAGALQDHRRALIVGDQTTYGKGTVQALLPINQAFLFVKNGPPLGAARITIQKWYRPRGESIQCRGVLPDIVFPSPNDAIPFGEADNERALPWDSIDASPWPSWGDGVPCAVSDTLIRELAAKFSGRRSSPEWRLLEERVEQFSEKVSRKRFSLRLEDRRTQKESDRAGKESIMERVRTMAKDNYISKDVFLGAAENESKRPPRLADFLEGDDDVVRDFDIPLREALRILTDWISIVGCECGAGRGESA
ncbi:MAG: carboxy terminal-processing peptidase [Puniceicoccales bacterium]|jgi:carboxyl-terminal processing protease|nr:carboxy terminal-processing peptidase [Puniceicoccales bacterium]